MHGELTERNQKILEMHAAGYTQRQIASTMGVSAARVNQILREHGLTMSAAFEEDSERWNSVERLDVIIAEGMKEILGPGEQAISPTGQLVYEPLLGDDKQPLRNASGKGYLPDFDKPVFTKANKSRYIDATIRAITQKAKMLSLDRRATATGNEAMLSELLQEFARQDEIIRRQNEMLAAHNLAPAVIEAEVVESEGDPA